MRLTEQIDRRSGLSAEDFEREYSNPLKPVILTDAIDHWPALGTWSPDYFRSRYGHLQVTVDGDSMTLASLIDRIEASTPENPAPYLRNQALTEWPPELLAAVQPPPACTRPNWFESKLFPSRQRMTFVEAYIGGEGAEFPVLHYDGLHTHAFLMQLYGDKEYIVFAPDQTAYMYPRPDDPNLSQVRDVLAPDLEQFPLFDNAEGVRFQLHPGETLFVPSGWWHTARILNPSVTVSVNGLNKANGQAFRRDYAAMVANSHSPLAGRAVSASLAVGEATRLFERV
jgi:Cupin-like domain